MMAKRKHVERAAQVYVGWDEHGNELWWLVMLPEAFRVHAAFWAWLAFPPPPPPAETGRETR